MQDEKTNFDRYLERKLRMPIFARFEAADQAWDIALQLAALRQARADAKTGRRNAGYQTTSDRSA